MSSHLRPIVPVAAPSRPAAPVRASGPTGPNGPVGPGGHSGSPRPVAAPPKPAEPPRACLARNVAIARLAVGWTQEALAQASGVSRATIAQIESGTGDPRLSTIVELATALGVNPLLLLLGERELRAFSAGDPGSGPETRTAGNGATAANGPFAAVVPEPDGSASAAKFDVETMSRLVASGMIKHRRRAARLAAAAARSAGIKDAPSLVGAAIGSAVLPGAGTVAGIALGRGLAGHPDGSGTHALVPNAQPVPGTGTGIGGARPRDGATPIPPTRSEK